MKYLRTTTKEKEFWHGKYNRPFKEIFGNEKYEDLLKEFLQRVLNQKINEITYLQTELKTGNLVERAKTVDLLVKTNKKIIHVEMNVNNPVYLHLRNACYFFNKISSQTKIGEDYDLEYEFIHIDFSYELKESKNIVEKYTLTNEDGSKTYLDNIEIWEFNMDMANSFWYNKDEKNIKKYKHLIMFDLDKDDLKTLSNGDDFVAKYTDELTKLNDSDEFQSWMTYEEDQQMILNTEKKMSYNEGLEKGQIDSKIEIAKKMLDDNVPLDKIMVFTDLSKEEILKLK